MLFTHSNHAAGYAICGLNGPPRCVKFSKTTTITPINLPTLSELRVANANSNSIIVKPTSALMPFRAAAAFTTTSQKDATSLTPHSPSFGKARKEVLLPSEEGTKGVIQYALYVKLQYPLKTPN